MIPLLFLLAAAQQQQNPSPMVEHIRPHTRLKQATPPGKRYGLELGHLFVPARHARKPSLLIFFHGGDWIPEVAAASQRTAVISAQIGTGSGVYARAFEDPNRLARLVHEAESKSKLRFGTITVGGWSAGCGAVRQLLATPASAARVTGALCIDGVHTSYTRGVPGPLESDLDHHNLEPWLSFAKEAMAGRKRLLITHSEIFPGTYASTTETAQEMLKHLHLAARASLRKGPMGTQQMGYAKRGRFQILAYAGNSAPDHVDQLHSLPRYLRMLK